MNPEAFNPDYKSSKNSKKEERKEEVEKFADKIVEAIDEAGYSEKSITDIEKSPIHKDEVLEQKVDDMYKKIEERFKELEKNSEQDNVEETNNLSVVHKKTHWDGKHVRNPNLSKDIPYEDYLGESNSA